MGQHVHSLEAPYHCDAYAESFSMNSDPTVCEHIHSWEYMNNLGICSNSFSTRGELMLH